MKRLYLVRHAKSSWKNPDLRDMDRPLNKRGKRNLPVMAQWLYDRGTRPDLIISSPAKRARKTAKGFARALTYPKKRIVIREEIYAAGVRDLLDLLAALDNEYFEVLMVGHNPGFTILANLLSGQHIANVPTCGIVALDFDIHAWSEISSGSGSLLFFDFPKNIAG